MTTPRTQAERDAEIARLARAWRVIKSRETRNNARLRCCRVGTPAGDAEHRSSLDEAREIGRDLSAMERGMIKAIDAEATNG